MPANIEANSPKDNMEAVRDIRFSEYGELQYPQFP